MGNFVNKKNNMLNKRFQIKYKEPKKNEEKILSNYLLDDLPLKIGCIFLVHLMTKHQHYIHISRIDLPALRLLIC